MKKKKKKRGNVEKVFAWNILRGGTGGGKLHRRRRRSLENSTAPKQPAIN